MILTTGEPALNIERRGETPAQPGLLRHWVASHFPICGPGGTPESVGAIVVEVTEQRRAEKELEERTAYLDALVRNCPVAIVALDIHARVQMCNPAFERLFLYSRSEIVGTPLGERITPAELFSRAAGLTKRILSGETVHTVTRRRRKGGMLLDVEVYGVPLVVDGRQIGMYCLYQDITEHKRAQEELRQLSGRLLHLRDEEQRRIARELHETTAQSLVALKMNLALVNKSAAARRQGLARHSPRACR